MPTAPRHRQWVPNWIRSCQAASVRVLLLGSAVVTLVFFIFFAALLLAARQDVSRQADEAASNIAVSVEQDIARNLELFDESLQAASDGLQLPDIWDLSPQLRNLVLFNRASRARYLGFINVLNETGEVIADSRQTPPRTGNYAGTDYFTAHRRDPRNILFIGGPILTRPDQPTSITVSRRLSHPDGSFAGVVVGSIQLAYFRELFSRFSLGPHGMITLLRTDGTILMRLPFNAEDIGHRDPAGAAFYAFMQTRNAHIDAVTVPGFDPGINNLTRRFTYRQIGDTPLVVSVGLATDDIFAAWTAKATAILAGLGVLCVANFGLAVLLHRQWRHRAAAEAAYRQLTDSASDLITRIDNDGVCRYASSVAWRMLGMAPATLVGHQFGDALLRDDRVAFSNWLARLRDNAAAPSVQLRAQHEDGSQVWVETAASRLADGSQEFVLVSRDVTARHQLDVAQAEHAHDLERTNAELDECTRTLGIAADAADEANDAKTRFLHTMAHEVRTPLHAILGHAELLGGEAPLDPAQASRVAAMRDAGEHLDDVLNRALAAAGIANKAAAARVALVDLPVLLEQTRAQIEPEARAKRLSVRCEIDRNVPHEIVTDATQVRQILLNLLRNAVKFTDRGEIVLRVSRQRDGLRCCVIDTGRGVPAEQRVRLFREAERLNAGGVEGSGLGLSISNRMANGLGGQLGYAANPGGGSMFWVDLSLSMALPQQQPTAQRDPIAMPSLRVLVVDDSAVSRDVTSGLLRNAGHNVIVAVNGEDGVRLAATRDFEVVLLDMCMPGIDGVETARRIRALPGLRGLVPMIAVTGEVVAGRWEIWRAAGIIDQVVKPCAASVLLAAMARATGHVDWTPPAAVDVQHGPDGLSEAAAAVDDELLYGHLRTLANEAATLMAMLREQDDHADPEALASLVHTIAGDAGMLGFKPLSAAAREYMIAAGRQPAQILVATAALLQAAATTEDLLHQLLSASRSASMASANVA